MSCKYRDCSGLTSVTIGSSVTSIGDRAFYFCSGLRSITIPNSVRSIVNCAFIYSGLTSITIPNSVTSIDGNAFAGCSALTSIIVEAGNLIYDSRNDCNAIIETATNTLVAGCLNTVIPESVTRIGDSAFLSFTDLTSVTIPNSVTSIGQSAFADCSGLTSVTIPNSVTSIGNYAFHNCSSLTSVTIGSSVTSIGGSAFYGCSSLTDVFCYAENVPTAKSNAFNRSPLESATLHVPAVSIESYKATSPWSKFGNIVALTSDEISYWDGIKEIESLTPALSNGEGDYYDLNGRKLSKPQKGINIIRHSGGTTRKVLLK